MHCSLLLLQKKISYHSNLPCRPCPAINLNQIKHIIILACLRKVIEIKGLKSDRVCIYVFTKFAVTIMIIQFLCGWVKTINCHPRLHVHESRTRLLKPLVTAGLPQIGFSNNKTNTHNKKSYLNTLSKSIGRTSIHFWRRLHLKRCYIFCPVLIGSKLNFLSLIFSQNVTWVGSGRVIVILLNPQVPQGPRNNFRILTVSSTWPQESSFYVKSITSKSKNSFLNYQHQVQRLRSPLHA